jgi:hypothetical protein
VQLKGNTTLGAALLWVKMEEYYFFRKAGLQDVKGKGLGAIAGLLCVDGYMCMRGECMSVPAGDYVSERVLHDLLNCPARDSMQYNTI